MQETEGVYSSGTWCAIPLQSAASDSAEMASRDLLRLLVELAPECGPENHSDTHPQTDTVYRNPETDTESEADASTTPQPSLRRF